MERDRASERYKESVKRDMEIVKELDKGGRERERKREREREPEIESER